MTEDVCEEEVALISRFSALTTQHLYATAPRRHFDVQELKEGRIQNDVFGFCYPVVYACPTPAWWYARTDS